MCRCAYVLRAVVSRPVVVFGLGWRGLWCVWVGACVGVSRSVVVVHLMIWSRFGVGLASGRRWGRYLCHRRTRRRGESAARVVLRDGCFL